MKGEITPLSREEQALFNELLSTRFGLHFPESKRQILQSRLEPRLRELRLRRFFDYYLKLQYDLAAEQDELIRRITNNETYFFREKGQFESLFGSAIETLRGELTPGTPLRLLSAGCSSGEEPYTLRIYATENRFRLGGHEVQVEALDLDREVLERAASGRYGRRSLRAISDDQAVRYFRTGSDGTFTLKQMYREGVSFRQGNILDGATFTTGGKYDAIFCRNVLIYFSESALRRTIDNFARALRPGGLLFLGHSESIIGMSPDLETVRLDKTIAYRRARP